VRTERYGLAVRPSTSSPRAARSNRYWSVPQSLGVAHRIERLSHRNGRHGRARAPFDLQRLDDEGKRVHLITGQGLEIQVL
jgi:hypothetical protein